MTEPIPNPTILARSRGGVRALRAAARRLARSSSAASFAARAVLVACGAYAIASLARLEQPMWAPVSGLIVLQGSTRETLRAVSDRLVGTLSGAAAAVVAALALAPLGAPVVAQMAVSVGVVAACVGAFRPGARVATWTSVIVLMSTIAPGHALTNALWRVVDVAIGAGAATAIGLLLPAPRGGALLRREVRAALEAMAGALRSAAPGGDAAVAASAVETALRRCEAVAASVPSEERGEVAAVVEAMRRLWHSLVTVRRVAAPVQGDAGVALNAVVVEARAMLGGTLDALAGALAGDGEGPERRELDDIVDAMAAAVRGLRADGVMRRLSDREAQAVYLRRFALERAVRDVADVMSRTAAAAA